MPLPRLLHPIVLTIQPVDKAATTYDRDTREPVRTVKRATTIRLPAQIRLRSLNEPGYSAAGLDEDAEGWYTVRVVDLAARNYTPKVGDRIIKHGRRDVEFYLRATQDTGHYPDQQGCSTMRLYFEDRRQSASGPRQN